MKKLLFVFLIFISNLAFAGKQKIVGISMDYRTNEDGKYDVTKNDPFYFVRENYALTLQKACNKYNVAVVLLPLNKDMIKTYSKMIDGLLIPGNFYDVDPKRYGEEKLYDSVHILNYRNDFEFALLDEMVKKKSPILGICGGEQSINVYFGGSLYQDLNKQVEGSMDHAFGKIPADSHKLIFEKGTMLSKFAKDGTFFTNS